MTTRTKTCIYCNGFGVEPPTGDQDCTVCGGDGVVSEVTWRESYYDRPRAPCTSHLMCSFDGRGWACPAHGSVTVTRQATLEEVAANAV